MSSPLFDLINNLPAKFSKGVEYYYRRGNRFFFRTTDKVHKVSVLCSPSMAELCKQQLQKKKIYTIVTGI